MTLVSKAQIKTMQTQTPKRKRKSIILGGSNEARIFKTYED